MRVGDEMGLGAKMAEGWLCQHPGLIEKKMKLEKTIHTKEGVFHIVWQFYSAVRGTKIVKAEIDDETGELRVYCKSGRKIK